MKDNKKMMLNTEQLHLSISEAVSTVYQSPYSSQEGNDDSIRSNSDLHSSSIDYVSGDGSLVSQSHHMDTHDTLRTDPGSYSVSPSRYNIRSKAINRAMTLLSRSVADEDLTPQDRVLVNYLLGQLDEILGGGRR